MSIILEQITKRFGNQWVVDNVSLEVADKELFVLLGSSGSGKSTILRMIAGLTQPTSGRILLHGRDVTDLPPQQRGTGFVFQNYSIFRHMTVAENIGFALRMRKVPKEEARRRVEETAKILGLAEHLQRKPRQLSGGQRQRVAMGRAIVREPAVFLMDEPLSNLDAKLRVQMRAEIRGLQREIGTTTIYVTHDQVEAMTMGDRVAVLRNGVLQQVASPLVLYHRPTNVFVAEFIGSPAMNLFEVPVDHGRELVLDSSERMPAPAWAVDQLSGRSRIVVGIRPEDLHIDGGGVGLHTSVRGTEDLGAEVIAHLETESAVATWRHIRELADELDRPRPESRFRRGAAEGDGVPLVARFAAAVRVREGERLRLTFGADKIHLFDVESGLALNRPDDGISGDERSLRSLITEPAIDGGLTAGKA